MTGVLIFLQPSVRTATPYHQQVLITNILSFILSWITLGIAGFFYSMFGGISTIPYIIFVAFLFLIVPFVNRWAGHRTGRLLFCLVPVLLTMFVTLHFKLNDLHHTSIVYFDSRFILMATPILPGIVFRLEERRPLFTCLGLTTFFIIFYDVIHQALGVDFYQKGFTDPSYYYINYIVAIAFLVLVFGILLTRSTLEKSETSLAVQNRDLHHKQHEIEAQHEELLQHQEEMMTSSEKLEVANALISKQQVALEEYNAVLEKLVAEKSQELLRTNEELIKYNNELLQFSYTVSHNLRGPVARILGLTNLFKETNDPEEKKQLQDMVVKSGEELDGILKDLSLIIDIRNEVYRVREKVFLQEEWSKAIDLLGENVKPEYRISQDFSEAPYIFGVRPMIQSILYNLLSNAIKYQSPDRPLQISIRSSNSQSGQTIVEISDNGLGIDLTAQEKNIFKLYKRFHSHVAGKGLGLYLVKTQVEALGGKIECDSSPGDGTTFRILFNEPEKVRKQVFHDTDAATVYYDAKLKVTIIEWKKEVSTETYRRTFTVVFDSLKVYKTPGWISDIRNQGIVSEPDQRWLIRTLASEAVKSGLRQIAVIGMSDENKRKYYEIVRSAAEQYGVTLKLCESMDEALEWMETTLT